jgi:SAM-dependent methyltransferase
MGTMKGRTMTMTSPDTGRPAAGGAGYVYPNAWGEARRRLALLEQASDPETVRHLESIGVQAGWRCLEVGAGGGSIARWLSRRVGATGRVTAVDVDTRFLDDDTLDNLDIQRRDVVADGMPGGNYDLVHCRLLLAHLPERERLVGDLVAALRRGGWLLVEEVDAHSVGLVESGFYTEAFRWFTEALAGTGVAWFWGRHLPGLLARSGLSDVTGGCHSDIFAGGSPRADLITLSWEQVRPLVVAAGCPVALLDDAKRELADPTRWFSSAAVVAAWGRRP